MSGNEPAIVLAETLTEVIPQKLLAIWKEKGFCSFNDGVITLVNPLDYNTFCKPFFAKNPVLAASFTMYYVIAKTAFGNLLVWAKHPDDSWYLGYVDIMCNNFEVISDDDFNYFFDVLLNDDDYLEEYFDLRLFIQCKELLGPPTPTECYGFDPIPAIVGKVTKDKAQRLPFKSYFGECVMMIK